MSRVARGEGHVVVVVVIVVRGCSLMWKDTSEPSSKSTFMAALSDLATDEIWLMNLPHVSRRVSRQVLFEAGSFRGGFVSRRVRFEADSLRGAFRGCVSRCGSRLRFVTCAFRGCVSRCGPRLRFVTRRLPRLRYQVRFEVEVCYMARFGVALPGAVLGWMWVTRLVLAWRFEARFEVGCGLRGLFWRGVTRRGSRVEAGG